MPATVMASRWPRRLVLFVIVLAAGFVALLSSGTGDAWANSLTEEGVACWVTGNPRGPNFFGTNNDRLDGGWGSDYEYSLDKDFFWAIANQALDANNRGLAPSADRPNEQGYYRNLAEAVDVAFASYWEDFQHYGRVDSDGNPLYHRGVLYADTLKLLNSGDETKGWNARQGVIEKTSAYLERRAVALYQEDRVQQYVAQWYNPWNPEGGLALDFAALSTDQQALMKRMAENTAAYVSGGNRIITGTDDVPVVLYSMNLSADCPAGTSCNFSSNSSSTPSTVTVRRDMVDQSNNERMAADVGDDVADGNMDVRGQDSAGYSHTRQADSGEDQIMVLLSLNPEYRQDSYFQIFEDEGQSRILYPGFGSDPWTYKNFSGGIPPDKVGLDPDGSGDGTIYPYGADPLFDWGYRQPTLGVAWDASGNREIPYANAQGFLGRGGYGDRYAGSRPGEVAYYSLSDGRPDGMQDSFFVANGSAHQLAEQWRQIRWPANFEDLNWYLYEVPGRANGLPDEQQWFAYWMTERGYGALLGSGYMGSTMPPDDPDAGDGCYFTDSGGEEQGGSEFQVRGQSDCHDDVYTEGEEWDKGELRGGRNYLDNSGMYPFQGIESDATAPTTRFYHLDHAVISANPPWRSVTEASSALGIGPWGYLAQPETRAGGQLSGTDPDAVLVKAGVERAIDADSPGVRNLSYFQFAINEQIDVGSTSVQGRGREALNHFGAPGNEALLASYVTGWPSAPINPNQVYLLVVTFYEVYQHGPEQGRDDRQQYDMVYAASGDAAEDVLSDVRYYLPERRIRRVICRMAVFPPGFRPTSSEDGGGFLGWALDRVKEGAAGVAGVVTDFAPVKLVTGAVNGAGAFVGNVVGVLASGWEWLGNLFLSFIRVPTDVAGVGVGVSCEGMNTVGRVFTDGAMEEENNVLVRADGKFIESGAAQSRSRANDFCEEFSASPIQADRCSGVSDAVYEGECGSYPKMDLKLKTDRFRLENPGSAGVEFDSVNTSGTSSDPNFKALLTVDQYREGTNPYPNTMGLSRVALAVESRLDNFETDSMDGVSGFVYEVSPDPKVFGDNVVYLIPEYVRIKGKISGADNEKAIRADMVSFGDMGLYDGPAIGMYDSFDANQNLDISGIGSAGRVEDTRKFLNMLERMPVAPGFRHRLRVALYGTSPDGEYVQGPWSDWVTVDGNFVACRGGADKGFTDFVKSLYGCEGYSALPERNNAQASIDGGGNFSGGGPLLASVTIPSGQVADSDLRLGLVDLSGTALCGDFFTTSPPSLTWDNTVVKMGWRLVWIIAGSVLFVLFVWQGLSMTYDTWIARQPAVGFRELIPRFVLSVLLAVASYWICKTVLILSSDLSCFVAHTTGMTMFGTLIHTMGAVFVALKDMLLELHWSALLAASIVVIIILWFKAVLVLVPVVFFLAIGLIIWLKVLFAMIVRLALISVLIVFSPVAFAFYSSPSTEHWTKTWVSLFLGAVFQQVVVLLVLYIGGALLYDYVYDATESWSALARMFIGLPVAIATLALADRVPRIINPRATGWFDGFGPLLKMAAAAAVTVGSAGAGFISGAARGAGGSTMSVSGATGQPGSGGGSASASASTSGGGSSAAPAPASRSGIGGMLSDVGGRVDSAFGGRLSAGFQGAASGFQQGRSMSNRFRDFAEGNFLYRNASFSDDAANSRQKKQNEMHSMLSDMWRRQQSGP